MALQLAFNVCQSSDCKELIFTETTGIYDATNNPTGWGSPNATIASAVSATLTITKPDGTVTSPINIFPSSFPTTNDDLEYTITAAALGYTANSKLPDGLYTVLYTVVAGSTTYTQTKSFLFSCQIRCCVYSMAKDIAFLECTDCKDEAIDKLLKAWALYQALLAAANCGLTAKFEELMDSLERLCLNTSCNNCS